MPQKPSMLLFQKNRLHICHIYEKRRKTIFAGPHNSLSILLITVDSCCAFPRAHRQIDIFPPFFVNILVRGRVQTAPREAENRLLHSPEEPLLLTEWRKHNQNM